MTPDTLLYRQVHRNWLPRGRLCSLTFKPSREENEFQVSVDDGDQISAASSYAYHREKEGFDSVGVVAVTHEECGRQNVTVTSDPIPGHEFHALLRFPTGLSNRQRRQVARHLMECAELRGWQYRPAL